MPRRWWLVAILSILGLAACTGGNEDSATDAASADSTVTEGGGVLTNAGDSCDAAEALSDGYEQLAGLALIADSNRDAANQLVALHHTLFIAATTLANENDGDDEALLRDLATDNLAAHLLIGWELTGVPADVDADLVDLVTDWDLSGASERRAAVLDRPDRFCGAEG